MATTRTSTRCGAIAPLMAILFPVILLICGICVNFAYMQLNRTQLKVATDAAARAAGRAFSEYQDVDVAIDYAVTTGRMNYVGQSPLEIDPQESEQEILFGLSRRTDNGKGRYEFIEKTRSDVRDKIEKATAVRVLGKRTEDSIGGSINMLFAGFGPFDQFSPVVSTTSTQVDRDIALVLDRSGSMLEYKDYPDLYDEAYRLNAQGRISSSQRNRALTSSIWDRRYPYRKRVWNGYRYVWDYRWFHHWHSDNSYDEDLWEYAYDYHRRLGSGSTPAYNTNDPAPRHSRWDQLEEAVDAFLTVLDDTDQEERVSLTTFNSSAGRDENITSDYNRIRSSVMGTAPKNGTNIAEGMLVGGDSIMDHDAFPEARFYAAKTLIVMSDGQQTVGSTSPRQQAVDLVDQYNIVIHTVTFSTNIPEYAREEMREVARIGGGKHYHADTGAELVTIFREIANNLPTMITE